jgi:hypothetical protein
MSVALFHLTQFTGILSTILTRVASRPLSYAPHREIANEKIANSPLSRLVIVPLSFYRQIKWPRDEWLLPNPALLPHRA